VLVELPPAARTGSVQPRIDAIFPFTEAVAADRRILQRQNIGKILLTP
jgi:synaptic vesicle membrane protein VAT-1